MAYNSFPVGYQPAQIYYPQNNAFPTNQNVNPTTPTQSGIIWVQGEAGAKSYLVAPNTTVQLWDSEEQVIYLKSADASGMPSIKTLDYTVRGENLTNKAVLPGEQGFDYRDEITALKTKIEGLEKEMAKLKPGKDEK